MPKFYESSYALCPFYHYETRSFVGCEGTTDHNVIRLSFANVAHCTKHKNNYCYNHYRNCKIYQMLMKKYE